MRGSVTMTASRRAIWAHPNVAGLLPSSRVMGSMKMAMLGPARPTAIAVKATSTATMAQP